MKNEWFLNYYCPSNAFCIFKWRIKLKSAIGPHTLANTRDNKVRRFLFYFFQFNETQIIHENEIILNAFTFCRFCTQFVFGPQARTFASRYIGNLFKLYLK